MPTGGRRGVASVSLGLAFGAGCSSRGWVPSEADVGAGAVINQEPSGQYVHFKIELLSVLCAAQRCVVGAWGDSKPTLFNHIS